MPERYYASGRIIGGLEASPHQMPWMVKLGSAHNNTCGKCGGTLISNRHVITAGHCVDEEVQRHWKRSQVGHDLKTCHFNGLYRMKVAIMFSLFPYFQNLG